MDKSDVAIGISVAVALIGLLILGLNIENKREAECIDRLDKYEILEEDRVFFCTNLI